MRVQPPELTSFSDNNTLSYRKKLVTTVNHIVKHVNLPFFAVFPVSASLIIWKFNFETLKWQDLLCKTALNSVALESFLTKIIFSPEPLAFKMTDLLLGIKFELFLYFIIIVPYILFISLWKVYSSKASENVIIEDPLAQKRIDGTYSRGLKFFEKNYSFWCM